MEERTRNCGHILQVLHMVHQEDHGQMLVLRVHSLCYFSNKLNDFGLNNHPVKRQCAIIGPLSSFQHQDRNSMHIQEISMERMCWDKKYIMGSQWQNILCFVFVYE